MKKPVSDNYPVTAQYAKALEKYRGFLVTKAAKNKAYRANRTQREKDAAEKAEALEKAMQARKDALRPRKGKKQGTRMLKVECPCCGFKFRAARTPLLSIAETDSAGPYVRCPAPNCSDGFGQTLIYLDVETAHGRRTGDCCRRRQLDLDAGDEEE